MRTGTASTKARADKAADSLLQPENTASLTARTKRMFPSSVLLASSNFILLKSHSVYLSLYIFISGELAANLR